MTILAAACGGAVRLGAEMITKLEIYDVATDEMRPVTQKDILRLQDSCLFLASRLADLQASAMKFRQERRFKDFDEGRKEFFRVLGELAAERLGIKPERYVMLEID